MLANHGHVQRKPKMISDSGRAVIVPQQAAESFAAFDFPSDTPDLRTGIDQPVFQTLMVPFRVEMGGILIERSPQRTFTEKDHLIQRFGFQASHKSFQMSIQIRTSRGEQDRFHTRTAVRFGPTCRIHFPSGLAVIPAISIRRDLCSIGYQQ